MSLNRLTWLRQLVLKGRWAYRCHISKMDTHPTAQMSFSAKPDQTFPLGVHIGEYSYVAFDARILPTTACAGSICTRGSAGTASSAGGRLPDRQLRRIVDDAGNNDRD